MKRTEGNVGTDVQIQFCGLTSDGRSDDAPAPIFVCGLAQDLAVTAEGFEGNDLSSVADVAGELGELTLIGANVEEEVDAVQFKQVAETRVGGGAGQRVAPADTVPEFEPKRFVQFAKFGEDGIVVAMQEFKPSAAEQ